MPYADPEERRACRRRKVRRRLHILASIKVTVGCVDCGYAANPDALQFNHVRGEKIHVVSRIMGWDATWIEVGKCDVRCANCHMIKSAEARRV